MPAITLLSAEGSLLAFVLIAGNEELAEGSDTRECILTGTPQDPADFDHPISIVRLKHLHTEHQAKVRLESESLHLEIELAESGILDIALPDMSNGTWKLTGEAGQTEGSCGMVKPKHPGE